MNFNPNEYQDVLVTDAKVAERCMRAGKGKLVLYSPSTGKAHGYVFNRPDNPQDFDEGTIFVYARHEDRRFYIGKLVFDKDFNLVGFRLTRSSKFNPDTEVVKGAYYMVRMATDQSLIDKGDMQLYHSRRCCKCGRYLEDQDSRDRGMGKKCLTQWENYLQNIKVWDGNTRS